MQDQPRKGLREHQAGKKADEVRLWFLHNPETTISQARRAMPHISQRTIATVRSQLATQGVLKPGRNRGHLPPSPVPQDAPAVPGSMVTGQQLMEMAAEGHDTLDDLDDDETRKRLLREVKKIAFAPDAHPDIRLSATQVWLKLKDIARSKELGPGKPLTRQAAAARLTDLLRAISDVTLATEALANAYGLRPVVEHLQVLANQKGATDEGQVSADSGEALQAPDGPPPAPGGEDRREEPQG